MVGAIGGSVLGISGRVYKINQVVLASGGRQWGSRKGKAEGTKFTLPSCALWYCFKFKSKQNDF